MKNSFFNPKPRENPRPLSELEERQKRLGINRLLAGIAFIFLGFQIFTMIRQNAEWYLVAIMGVITLAIGFLGLLFHKYVTMIEAEMKMAEEMGKSQKKEEDKNIWDDIEEMKADTERQRDDSSHPEDDFDFPEETL